MLNRAVVVLSGGLDSCTALYRTRYNYPTHELFTISFNYGQKHSKELEYASKQSAKIGAEHKEINLTSITDLLAVSNSSLVSDTNIPDGHYAEDSMKSTVVPNRNMIMASIAAGYVIALNADIMTLGVHGGDHFIYPDCRPLFIQALYHTIMEGNAGFISKSFEIFTPYINENKNDIAWDALRLGVPIADTWSCYKGETIHCGRCGTCVERMEAIASTEIKDPTTYDDYAYWREVTNSGEK